MSMTGKTILITGATDGVGKGVAHLAAKAGARVLVHGRDRAKTAAVVAEVRIASGNDNVTGYLADLASLDQVRALAAAVQEDEPRLDVLVNNAGVGLFGGGGRELSDDGLEMHFQVNYLAPFLLTLKLLPLIRQSAPARIVNVSSIGQAPIDFEDVMLEQSYSGLDGYRQSKLAQIMFTFDLSEQLKGSGVTVTAVHPGTFMNTKMVTGQGMKPQSRVEDGSAAVWRLASSPDVEGQTGVFYNELALGRANDQAYDVKARRALWNLSLRLAGLQAAAVG
jgi:NAD(P)-dependent dehydrogenase (short-subunit alcohol dehydrogenase family)